MAFSTTSGHYQYLVMPYGLASVPTVFQCLINNVLIDFLGRCVIAYINDILIYTPDYATHVCQIWQVLFKLCENQLYFNGGKCEFHATEISFLGYIFSSRGICMDQNKVQAVTSWPTPQTVKELQCFLGFANFYQRFMCNFSTVAAPITALLSQLPFFTIQTWNGHSVWRWMRPKLCWELFITTLRRHTQATPGSFPFTQIVPSGAQL